MSVRLLVVDDAPFMREILRKMLEPEGFRVVGEAAGGIEAIRLFRDLAPELVVMDLVMPGCSGIQAVRAIRTLEHDARIVMCSSPGQEALVMEALQAGALDYVVKPPRRESILTTMLKIFRPRAQYD